MDNNKIREIRQIRENPRFRRYPEYKESGMEWIGEIPKHWKRSRLKYESLMPVQYGLNINSDLYVEQGIRFIRTTDITDDGELIDKGVYLETESVEEIYLTQLNDFLISRSGTLGRAYLHQSDEKHTYGGYLVRFNFGCSIKSRFIFYFTKSRCFEHWITLNTIQSTIGNVNGQKYSNLEIFLPSLTEQAQIANFLDRKTEQIDELIQIKERQIELLQKQRTALINQAVTKGLDPNVEMKPSGVEWVGEIPKHWDTIPIKHTLQIAKDSIRAGPFGSSLKSHEFQENGIRVYNQQSVYNEDFSKSDIFISEKKFDELRSFIVQPKDVLITSRGTIGKMTIVPKNGEIGVLHPCLIRLRLNEDKLILKYLWWYVNHSSFFIESVKIASNSTTIEVIYTETLSNVKIPIPTVKEQLAILEFLNVKIPIIDTTISNELKKIERLKEYSQSLISEAVTGKIDVRNEV